MGSAWVCTARITFLLFCLLPPSPSLLGSGLLRYRTPQSLQVREWNPAHPKSALVRGQSAKACPLDYPKLKFSLSRTLPLASRRPPDVGTGSCSLPSSGLKRPDTPFFHLSWLEGEWDNQCQTFFKSNFWWMSSFHSPASKTWYGFAQRHGKMWLLRFGKRHESLCGLGETKDGSYKMLILIAYGCLATCL